MLNEKFCNRLHVMRVEKGLSQENLALMLGLSANGYAKIERGETEASLPRIEQIAKVLDVDVSFLLDVSNANNYTNSGNYFGGHNHGPVTYQVDKLALDEMLKKIRDCEHELEEMRVKHENEMEEMRAKIGL